MLLKSEIEQTDEDQVICQPTDNNFDKKSSPLILYKKRYIILILFILCSFTNAFQWIHLNIISDRVSFFWNNSLPESTINKELAINWLSMIYMLTYIPFIIPAMWFLEHKGLKKTIIIASALNALGAGIKCFSVSLDGKRFPILLFGQSFCALSQIFSLGIPAHLAAVWFGANEVSTATSLGVFGNQLGIGFGFVIPPLIMPLPSSNSSMEMYQERFNIMFYSGAAVTTAIFVVTCIVFDRKPPSPPSKAQMFIQLQTVPPNYKKSLSVLASNTNFVLLVISYGINTGCFYGISTILNSILLFYFAGTSNNNSSSIGLAGFLMILSGTISSVLIGIVLDKTKAFRACVISVYVLSALSMGGFAGGLYLYSWAVVFVTIVLLGFFMTGYLPLGFEIAAEMTYPANEGLTSGILNLSAQIFGILFTYVGTILLDKFGALTTNLCLVSSLLGGVVLTAVMKIDLRRQKAHGSGQILEVQSGNINSSMSCEK